MDVQRITSLKDIVPAQWDALRSDNHPLLSHAFLLAMEVHHCLTEQSGWQPRYLIIRDDNRLIAAMLLYEKTNSWGEFVFDHSWADAYARHGLNYFPKLVSSIPFSPVLGNKLLLGKAHNKNLAASLINAAIELTEQISCSSLHVLFPPKQEQVFLNKQAFVTRIDCQYHWQNRAYSCFDDFLACLTSRKRKNIRRERDKIRAQGITFRHLDGLSAKPQDWKNFTDFYKLTYERKWGAPIFSQAFFESVAAALGEQMILVLADRQGECIAGALMYKSDSILYGRHWGCVEYHDALHFEACYYQGIEICIKQNLQVFEPGAQGDHKIARGFEPVLTHSYHWLADQRFVPAIKQFCKDESSAVRQYAQQQQCRSPYK